MKLIPLLLGTLLALFLVAGCAKKPVAYTPKDASETTVLSFINQKVPGLVVIGITTAQVPGMDNKMPVIKKPGALPELPRLYSVTLADPNDDSKQTSTSVFLDVQSGKIDEAMFRPPSPVAKIKKK